METKAAITFEGTPLRRFMRRLARLAKEPVLLASILVIFALLALFIIYPVVMVLIKSFTSAEHPGIEVYKTLLSSSYVRSSLYNSLSMGAAAALLSCVVGFLFAYAVTRTDMPFKGFFNFMAIVPIVSPPFLGAVSVLLLFGSNGLITSKLLGIYNYPIYGFKGLLFAQVVTFFPVAYLTLKGVLESISPTLEDAALDLGSSRLQVFGKVTLPLALPGIASALLVIFIESLADFGNPLVLAGSNFPTLSVQAYLQITGMYDLPGGAALSVVLLIPSITAFMLQKYWVEKRKYVTVTGKPTSTTIKSVSSGTKWALFGLCLFVAGVVILFYGVIVAGAFAKLWGIDPSFTLRNFEYVWGVVREAIMDTLLIAGISTPISGLLGMAIAFLVVRKSFPGKNAMDFISMLSFALPGTVVGIGYILAFNRRPFLLTGTLAILVLNFVFRYFPVGIQAGVATLRQVDASIEEAAANLGAGTEKTFAKVTLPLIAPAFFSAPVFAFVRAMTAISAAVFLVSADWNLMTVQILYQVNSGRLGAAAAFSVVLIGIIVVAMVVIRLVVDKLLGIRYQARFQGGGFR